VNRQRYVERDFEGEGSDRAQALGLALGQVCDARFLEAILHHKAAIDEFGGQLYIAAAREKFDAEGNRTDGPGAYETFGYVFLYGSKAKLAGRLAETADAEAAAAPPEVPEAVEPEPEEPVEPVSEAQEPVHA